MNYDDMKHKMVPRHWDILRCMLKVNEVPEPVMVRYFLLKKYTDKLSAPLSVMDLLRIAIDVGFDVETGKFETALKSGDTILFGKDKKKVLLVDKAATQEEIAEMSETVDEIVELTKPEDVDPNEETTVIEDPKPEYEDGAEVTVYFDGDAKQCVIESSEKTPGGWNYKVVTDGETKEVSEDDIE